MALGRVTAMGDAAERLSDFKCYVDLTLFFMVFPQAFALFDRDSDGEPRSILHACQPLCMPATVHASHRACQPPCREALCYLLQGIAAPHASPLGRP